MTNELTIGPLSVVVRCQLHGSRGRRAREYERSHRHLQKCDKRTHRLTRNHDERTQPWFKRKLQLLLILYTISNGSESPEMAVPRGELDFVNR